MRRMLDPKEAGGSLPSTVKFDAEGNRTVGKNLEVNGKLKLKSLVSASNPDGDITKELGGGGGTAKTLYKHTINIWSSTYGNIYLTIYNTSNEQINSEAKFKTTMKRIGKIIATGYSNYGQASNVYFVKYLANEDKIYAYGFYVDKTSGNIEQTSTVLDYHFSSFVDDVSAVS